MPNWEEDVIGWEYWEKELREWKMRLEDILMKSLKLKYDKGYVHHLGEQIPHFHGKGKESTELTKEVSFKVFIEKVKLIVIKS